MSKQLTPSHRTGDSVCLEKIIRKLPVGFEVLRTEARAEGYRHLERLATDWASGAARFDREGEALFVAYVDGELAAIGGITVDPVIPDALRMRRFYVGKRFRRHSVGRRIALSLLDGAGQAGHAVMVNAAAGSAPFWEALGFVPDRRDGRTHILKQMPDPV